MYNIKTAMTPNPILIMHSKGEQKAQFDWQSKITEWKNEKGN